jgi:hypothetical protein
LTYFNILLELQLPTDSSVRFWTATLGSLVSYQEFFDIECKHGVKNATSTIFLKVGDLKMSTEVFDELGRVINALVWTNQRADDNMNQSPSTEIVSSNLDAVLELMDLYVQAVSSTIILQETTPDFVSETLASRVRRFGVFDDLVIEQPNMGLSEFLQMVRINTGYFNDYDRNVSSGQRKLDVIDDPSGDSMVSIGMGLVSYNRKVYGNQDVAGDGLSLQLSVDPCNPVNPSCTVEITFPIDVPARWKNSYMKLAEPSENISVSCALNTITNTVHVCANGVLVNATCNGTWSGVQTHVCPVLTTTSNCSIYRSGEYSPSECTLSSQSYDTITCICPSSVLQRRERSSKTSSGAISSPQFVPLLTQTMHTFAATWTSADSLTVSDIEKGWIVFLSIVMLGAFAVLLLVSGYYLDRNRINPSSFILNGPKQSEKLDGHINKEMKMSLGHLVEMSLIEDSKMLLFLRSMIHYHRWFSVYLRYNEIQPRIYRATSLIGYLLILTLGNTVAFQVSNTSMGCYDIITSDACELEPSPVSEGANCMWNEDTLRCEPRALGLVGVLYLALICFIFTIPLTVIQDYLVDNVLRAQVRSEDDVSNEALSAIEASSCERTVASITEEVVIYRSGLSDIDGAEFDDMWGTVPLRSTGETASYLMPKYVQSQLLRDIKQVERQRVEEVLIARQRQQDINLQITRLFVKDLLPYTASIVLSAIHRHENEARVIPSIRSRRLKVLAWMYLMATNSMILLYIIIFALQQDRVLQISLLRTLFVSLSGDVLILSTLVIYFNHVYVPQLFLSETQYMTSSIKNMFDNSKSVIYNSMERRFAANKYLFVSHWIALAHPSSKVSSIVLNYSTPWPRRSYKGASVNGVSIVALLTLFEAAMNLPGSLQNELCKFVLVAILANTATSQLFQRKYRTWVKIAVTLLVLLVLYVIGRLLGYVLRRVCGKHRWSLPMEPADLIPSDAVIPSSPSSPVWRASSLHVTRRASAAQAIEALQQVTEAISLPEAKDSSHSEVIYDSDDNKSSGFSESTSTVSEYSMALTQTDGINSDSNEYHEDAESSSDFSSAAGSVGSAKMLLSDSDS